MTNTTDRPTDPTARLARAVVYLRVSTDKQAQTDFDPEGLSLPAQREACLRKAEELEAEVVDEYVDRGESAKTADRPQFKKMLRRIQNDRDIDYVILDKINRFARNRRDDANVLFELKAAGATLISVKENIDDTPAGNLMHGILATLAEYESRNNGVEALKGMTQKARAGGTPGRAPVGYKNVRIPSPGQPRGIATVEIDEERAPHVMWAFEQYATGDWTVQALTDALDAVGLRALPRGSDVPGPMKKSRVHRMLKNRYYAGFVTFQGIEYEGRHDALISEELYEKVQSVLASKSRSGEKTRTHHHYLKGTVFCGECGTRLVFSRNSGNGGTYDYFKCIGDEVVGNGCTVRYIRSDWLEAEVEGRWADNVVAPDLADELRRVILDELANRFDWAREQLQTQHRRRDELDDQRTALLRAHLAGAVPLDLLKTEQARIAREIGQADAAIAAATADSSQVETNLDQVLNLAQTCHETYLQANPQIRRQLNQAFFHGINVHKDEGVTFSLASPFKELAAAVADRTGQPVPEGAAATISEVNDAGDLSTGFTYDDVQAAEGAPTSRRSGYCRTHGWNMRHLVPPGGFEPPHTV